MTLLKWLDRWLEEAAMMIMLSLIATIMGYSVIMRYVFNNSLSWAEEICRYLFVWSAFLSAPLCLKRRSSIKIDMLVAVLNAPLQRLLLIVGDLVMLGFFSIMLLAAWRVTLGVYHSGQSSPALMLPMYCVYSASVAGFALSVIRLLQRLRFLIFAPDVSYGGHLDAGRGEGA